MPRQQQNGDPPMRERIAAIEADVRWLKYLVTAVFVATLGQYAGLSGTVAEAVSRHLP